MSDQHSGQVTAAVVRPVFDLVWDRPFESWRVTVDGEFLMDDKGVVLKWRSFSDAYAVMRELEQAAGYGRREL